MCYRRKKQQLRDAFNIDSGESGFCYAPLRDFGASKGVIDECPDLLSADANAALSVQKCWQYTPVLTPAAAQLKISIKANFSHLNLCRPLLRTNRSVNLPQNRRLWLDGCARLAERGARKQIMHI
jgi:hypothetical protein